MGWVWEEIVCVWRVNRFNKNSRFDSFFFFFTMLTIRSRASLSSGEALERRSFQTGLDSLELDDLLHIITSARCWAVSAVSADACGMNEPSDTSIQPLKSWHFVDQASLLSHRGTGQLFCGEGTQVSTTAPCGEAQLQRCAVVSNIKRQIKLLFSRFYISTTAPHWGQKNI